MVAEVVADEEAVLISVTEAAETFALVTEEACVVETGGFRGGDRGGFHGGRGGFERPKVFG
jgi:hypothetical protein